MSALSLMAAHEHKYVKVVDGRRRRDLRARDPGQRVERVARDRRAAPRRRRGRARPATSPVHVSGHASQEELKFMLNLLSPEWFVPVHGEYRHLVHHAQPRARGRRCPTTTCSSARTATSSRSATDGARRRTARGARRLHCTSTASSATSARACCATGASSSEEGVVVVIVTVDAATGEIVTGPEIVTRGWVYAPEAEELLEDAKQVVRDVDRRGRGRGRHRLRHDAPPRPQVARPFIDERTRRRPAVIPVVMEV